MPKGDAMSSSGFSIRTPWATRICKEKNFISRIQVHPHIRVWHPDYRASDREEKQTELETESLSYMADNAGITQSRNVKLGIVECKN